MFEQIQKLILSFKNAIRGVKQTYNYEKNFRIHICAMMYVLFFAVIGEVSRENYLILFLCFALMLGLELINTSFERLCDKTNEGFDKSVKDAKDIAAGAVFVVAIFCVIIGMFIFTEKHVFQNILQFFSGRIWALIIFLLTLPISAFLIYDKK